MSSVVVELQRESLDRNIPVSDILRKAFVIAKKLGLKEFEDWVNKELNGYESGKDIPEYRVMNCQLKGWNPYHGWVSVIFPDPTYAEKLSNRTCGQSIAEIESLIENRDDTSFFQMPLPHEIHQLVCEAICYTTEITSFVPYTGLIRILNAVRTIILNWALKLEEDGILGEGLSFTHTEKQTASAHAYQVNHFYGATPDMCTYHNGPDQSTHFHADVSKNNIAIHSTDVHQSLELPDELSNLFSQMLSALQSDISLSEAERRELVADVETLKTELKRTHPRKSIVGTLLSTLGNVSSITGFIIQIGPHLPQLLRSINIP
jgi:hypothetical protein